MEHLSAEWVLPRRDPGFFRVLVVPAEVNPPTAGQEGVWQFEPSYTRVYLLPLVNCDCIFGAESLTTVPAASSFGANFGAPTQSNLVFLGIFQGLVFSWGRMPPPWPLSSPLL